MKKSYFFYLNCTFILLALFGAFLVLIGVFSPIVTYPVEEGYKFYFFYTKVSYFLFLLSLLSLLVIISGKLQHLFLISILQVILISISFFDFKKYLCLLQNNLPVSFININYFGWNILYLGAVVLLLISITNILLTVFFELKMKRIS